jgi:hypothetical protein
MAAYLLVTRNPSMKSLYIFFTFVFSCSVLFSFGQTRWLDSTFGTRGKVIATNGNSFCDASSIITLNDGKMIIGGSTASKLGDGVTFLIGKFNADGSIDSSFGNKGFTVLNFGYLDL